MTRPSPPAALGTDPAPVERAGPISAAAVPATVAFAASPAVLTEIAEVVPEATFSTFHVRQEQYETRSDASLLATGISGSATGVRAVVTYEAMLLTDELKRYDDLEVRYGAGVRLWVEVTDLTADFAVNAYAVAIAVDAGLASASYKIEAFGIPTDVPFLSKLPPPGPFDGDSYVQIMKLVGEAMEVLAEADRLVPSPIEYRVVDAEGELLEQSRQMIWAVRNLRERVPLVEAMEGAAEAGVPASVVRLAYTRFGVKDGMSVERSVARQARRWLAFRED